MKHIRKLAEEILYATRINSSKEEQLQTITNYITWYVDDTLKLIKNIEKTSYNESDKTARFIEIENKYGIPKTHLIIN